MEVFDALSSLRRLRVVEINPFLMFVNDRLDAVNGRSCKREIRTEFRSAERILPFFLQRQHNAVNCLGVGIMFGFVDGVGVL